MNYRNTEDLVSMEGIEVEAGSLWKYDVNQELFVLVDEDQYASHKLDKSKFKKTEL